MCLVNSFIQMILRFIHSFSETEYGCCPDGKTAARGEDFLGCGCAHSSTGCCDDQVTVAPPEGKENCPCHTTEFGCCPDGQTTRGQAQNLQGNNDNTKLINYLMKCYLICHIFGNP